MNTPNPEPGSLDPGSPIPSHVVIAPIGVFDSGVGGLSVLREIRRELPSEDLIYVADSGYAPYGDRPEAYIRERAVAVMEFLRSKGAKAVVVACNTATGIAVDALRARYGLPIIAIEPAVKPAAAQTRSRVVGVLATAQTLAGQKFVRLVSTHAGDVEVLTQACPELVERVEAGELTTPATRAAVERYLRPLLEKGADTIVLGCTHYPFVAELIKNVAGTGVTVIDSAGPVARELRRRLQASGLLAPETRNGTESFWTTGSVDRVSDVIRQLWTGDVDVCAVPSAPGGERSAHAR
jgi:glutamate racemase